MSDEHRPYTKNVPGPFYTVSGCCMICMASHIQAPEMLGFDQVENHCFVARQPVTEEETYKAIRAVWASEIQCLRYSGQDPNILRRLVEIGEADACDQIFPIGSVPLLRNYVTFEATFSAQARDIAAAFKDDIINNRSEYLRYKFKSLKRDGQEVKFALSWYEDNYHSIWAGHGEPQSNRWLIHHSPEWKPGSVSLSLLIDDWLRGDRRFKSIRWYTAEAWGGRGREWQELPY